MKPAFQCPYVAFVYRIYIVMQLLPKWSLFTWLSWLTFWGIPVLWELWHQCRKLAKHMKICCRSFHLHLKQHHEQDGRFWCASNCCLFIPYLFWTSTLRQAGLTQSNFDFDSLWGTCISQKPGWSSLFGSMFGLSALSSVRALQWSFVQQVQCHLHMLLLWQTLCFWW